MHVDDRGRDGRSGGLQREQAHVEDDDRLLSGVDRRAIEAIGRELDAVYGPVPTAEAEAPGSPEASPAPGPPLDADARAEQRAERRRALAARGRTSRRSNVLWFVLGCALGAAVGSVVTLTWRPDPGPALPPPATSSATPSPAPAAPSSPAPPSPAAGPAVPHPQEPEADAAGASPRGPADDFAERPVLEQELRQWLEATRQRDFDRQMRFYPPRVPVYYAWRDVPRRAVRAEKQRVFGQARTIAIDVGPPDIVRLAPGEARMRFRKRYVIEGPRVIRRGEVLQELRWARTPGGWKIVAERDAAVLSPSP
jgi:hypothetical protein